MRQEVLRGIMAQIELKDNPGATRQAQAVKQAPSKTSAERYAQKSPDPRTEKSQERYSKSPAKQYNAELSSCVDYFFLWKTWLGEGS